ncbi:MAG: stage III sporulation protein AB [Defluviitaleaceae bacterium]|nr:stage III sporulation protein AB [Defluviitaleaceae bacterium]
MFPTIAGSLALIASCAAIGFYFAAQEGFRIKDLQEFKKALMILSSEIEHMRAPLPIACANIAKRTREPISTLFSDFAALLTDNEGETAYQLWAQALSLQKKRAHLAAEDWDVIEGFGKTLGYLDKQMQQSAITATVEYINEKTTSLQTQSEKNRRMYRSLGVIGGLLLVVVLW